MSDPKREMVEEVLRLWRHMPGMTLAQFVESGVTPGKRALHVDESELLANLRSVVELHGVEDPTPELGLADVLYFGCWQKGRTGHYLYRRNGQYANEYTSLPPEIVRTIDGAYCGDSRLASEPGRWAPDDESQPQNVGRLHRLHGWTILAFWDRTADNRYSANSAFFARGQRSFGSMTKIAELHFPAQWRRITAQLPMREAR